MSKLRKYEKQNYTRIDFQNCINPAFSLKLCEQFNKMATTHANKYDINSALITCLIHKDLLLPKTIKPKCMMVNKDADNFLKDSMKMI